MELKFIYTNIVTAAKSRKKPDDHVLHLLIKLKELESQVEEVSGTVREISDVKGPVKSTSLIKPKELLQRHLYRRIPALGLRVQFQLGTFSDLHEFLRDFLDELPAMPIAPAAPAVNRERIGPTQIRLSLLEGPQHTSKNQDMQSIDIAQHPLLPALYSVYFSSCFYHFQPVNNMPELRDQLARGTADPAFFHSLIAWTAQHIYQCHPDSPQHDLLPVLAKRGYEEARKLLADEAMENPSELTVLTALNLCMYLIMESNFKEQAGILSLMTAMAVQLKMDVEDPDLDRVTAETRRRLRWAIHHIELGVAAYGGRPLTFNISQYTRQFKPVLQPKETEETRLALNFLVEAAEWYSVLLKLPIIDTSLSDIEILDLLAKNLSTIKGFLPRKNEGRYCGQASLKDFSWADLSYATHVWSAVGLIWYNLLQPGPHRPASPPSRWNTPLMLELRKIALKESMLAACNVTALFYEIARRGVWCGQMPISSITITCHIYHYISLHHDNSKYRQAALFHLQNTYRIFHSKPGVRWAQAKGLIKWLKMTIASLRH
ncbi:uncharacterized protein VTP21DRAFT_4820 [Calcarisporiella thermophila]|uniref:uncharacterized protein n=1 Tax=Calcarisporiella thermophila TaxID=911321 RepID=UPI003742D58C